MPSLIDRISEYLRRFGSRQVATTADDTVAAATARGAGLPAQISGMFEEETGRANIVRVCRKMYSSDTRVKQVVQTLARDATKGGYRLDVQNNPRAQEIGDALRLRLKLDTRLDDWTRLTLRDGDSFLEVGVTAEREIATVTRKPTLKIRRNSTGIDTFKDPEKAFWIADYEWVMEPGRDTIWFAEWQVVHARWDHDEGERYGRPLFASGIVPWKRLVEGETDISVRRKTRAGMKYVHSLKDADEAAIRAYMELNKSAIGNPNAAIADFFLSDGEVSVLQGDAHLGDIDDVRHHLKTLWVASPVPMSIVGYGEDIDFSVVGHQKEQYDETLPQVREWITAQLLKPLLELQWLLAGILPDQLEYEITWAPKSNTTPQDIEAIAGAAAQLQALGIPAETIATIISPFLPGISQDMLLPKATTGAEEDE